MLDVKKGCNDEGCLEQPSHGLAESKEVEFGPKHARVGIVNGEIENSGEKGCFELDVSKRRKGDEAQISRQHATTHETAAVCDTAEVDTTVATSGRGPTSDGQRRVAHV